jgi:hypothetical protein
MRFFVVNFTVTVIHAKAGIFLAANPVDAEIPACAGMTIARYVAFNTEGFIQ